MLSSFEHLGYCVWNAFIRIYYHSEEQKKVAEASLAQQQSKYSSPIVTELLPASRFWEGEVYHQRYLEKGGQCAAKGDKTAIRCYG